MKKTIDLKEEGLVWTAYLQSNSSWKDIYRESNVENICSSWTM
jgi:hypothetical protein